MPTQLFLLSGFGLLLSSPGLAKADEATFSVNGQARVMLENYRTNSQSMLGELNHAASTSGQTNEPGNHAWRLENEIKLQGKHWYATLSTQLEQNTKAAWVEQTQLHQAYWSQESGAWQINLGRKLISWDVGLGYRPNDMVQREQRRNLYSTTLSGKDLISAEWFSATQALALVAWHNTNADTEQAPVAYALRYYQRLPSADWYGFARYSRDQGISLGSALSWVVNDALEFHTSLRLNQRNQIFRDQSLQLINASSPWRRQEQQLQPQILLGATYTNQAQQSWYLEYWYDGLALNRNDWRFWLQRQTDLRTALRQKSYPSAVLVPQFAWQTQAFNQAENLRQHNVFVRWSQQNEAWQSYADLLWHPEDKGRIVTLGASWQGDKTRLEFGLRRYSGPDLAVTRQLNEASKAFVNLSWAY